MGESSSADGLVGKVCVRLIVPAAVFTWATTAVNVAVVAVVVTAELEAVCAYAQGLPSAIANIAANTVLRLGSSAMPLNGKRILIVKDENLIALGLESEITAAGGEVVATAGSVDDALDLIATTDLDGAIVDIKLKQQRTFLVADALAARRIPSVFTTAMSCLECPARFLNVPWLEKPSFPGVILSALSGVLVK